MVETFLSLANSDRREALEVAAAKTGRPAHILEKDVWVVWALRSLFESPYGKNLVFKGGTSLSKAYGIIRRFSEDVDITYDIRALAPDLVGTDPDPIPPNGNQRKKWAKEISSLLPVWVAESVVPLIQSNLDEQGLTARIELPGDGNLRLHYEAATKTSSYVLPAVLLEFGARSTGEPSEVVRIECDAASAIPSVMFPEASARVMRPERTFWEKATAMHVYCLRGQYRGDRFARHWYDLARLQDAGIVESALRDRSIPEAVAVHKAAFFRERDRDGDQIDYQAAINGALRLVPEAEVSTELKADYDRMVDEAMFFEEVASFDALMEQVQSIQDQVNLTTS